MKKIRIVGITNYEKLEAYFNSNMVDVLYIDELVNGSADIIQDDPIHADLEREEDRKWLTEIIEEALTECGERSARIEFIDITHK